MKNIAAALLFFTRLPLYRLKAFNLPIEYFKQVIYYWALTGWLTAIVMSGTLWLTSQILPYSIAIIIALLSRLLLTGALHEDGLADFMDGFGGGINKEKILSIMKDSHIGTYGVIALICYYFLTFSILNSFPLETACLGIVIADPLCKFISSQVTQFLPYARTSETSKSKVVYDKISPKLFFISLFFGLLPLALIPDIKWLIVVVFPLITFIVLVNLMKKKISGYTGDCCGALFLLCELSFYLGLAICIKNSPAWNFI